MMDTLGLTVLRILMNVHQLNHLVKVVVYAQTKWEVLPAPVQPIALVIALLVAVALAKREELALVTIRTRLCVPVHQGLLETLVENLKVRV